MKKLFYNIFEPVLVWAFIVCVVMMFIVVILIMNDYKLAIILPISVGLTIILLAISIDAAPPLFMKYELAWLETHYPVKDGGYIIMDLLWIGSFVIFQRCKRYSGGKREKINISAVEDTQLISN